METIRLGLFNAHQAHQCLMEVWMAIKPLLVAGERLHLEIRSEKRSDPQNQIGRASCRERVSSPV